MRRRNPLCVCQNCKKEFIGKKIRKYCSLKCQQEYQTNQKIKDWESGKILGYTGKTIKIKQFIRNLLIKESGHRCSKCGWSKINFISHRVVLEINHIDGNSKNCLKENLEVLCPNCHSLTPNYKNLNKNSFRDRK